MPKCSPVWYSDRLWSSASEASFKFSTFKTVQSPCLDGEMWLQANDWIWIFLVKTCSWQHLCADLCLPDHSYLSFSTMLSFQTKSVTVLSAQKLSSWQLSEIKISRHGHTKYHRYKISTLLNGSDFSLCEHDLLFIFQPF